MRLLSEAENDDWQTEHDKNLEAEFKANGGEVREKGGEKKTRGGDNAGIQNMAAWLEEESPLVAKNSVEEAAAIQAAIEASANDTNEAEKP